MAYHPQTNGQVEWFNRTLKTMIAKFVNSRQDNWDIYLLAFLFTYRTSPHKSMGHTPYEVMLGRAPPSEDRVATELIQMDEWVQELRRRRPGSSFWPTSKVSSRTEWSQCPIGQEHRKLVTRSRYGLTTKSRAGQRQVGAQQPPGFESGGFLMEFQSPFSVLI